MQCHYVASNIVLLLSLQVLQNQQIGVLQPWLCGSVDYTANENKHHEEEARPHFSCSMLLLRSMHQPGYVQGGQEASFGYLLLGVYYRRIPGDTNIFHGVYFNVAPPPSIQVQTSRSPCQPLGGVCPDPGSSFLVHLPPGPANPEPRPPPPTPRVASSPIYVLQA